MADLNIIRVGGELDAATKGNGGGCRRKESSTVDLGDGVEYINVTIKDIILLGEQIVLNVWHLFLAFLLLQLSTPVPGLIVGLLHGGGGARC